MIHFTWLRGVNISSAIVRLDLSFHKIVINLPLTNKRLYWNIHENHISQAIHTDRQTDRQIYILFMKGLYCFFGLVLLSLFGLHFKEIWIIILFFQVPLGSRNSVAGHLIWSAENPVFRNGIWSLIIQIFWYGLLY